MTTSTQRAWEGLANSMRLYVESELRFKEIFALDREEAVKNQDMAMEAKLEKFHALYDITKKFSGFHYFDHGDTSLVIALRNAIHHHDDHTLFQSWNARILLNDAFMQLSGAEFLLGSTTPEEEAFTVRYYYLLDDFYARLPALKNADKHRTLWDRDLQFATIAKAGVDGRYPATQVYVDIMPAFISAVRRVRKWLVSTGFTPAGSDSEVYFECFGEPAPEKRLSFRRLRIP
ncbi:hypothetical protein GPY61_30435 [Massilia sp. NEAU-DD11]|uniref:Uncharacterized protein n=1 Tax=Massilia cellulosiltytica TaxID=2683234 RepID=A0A7X3G5W2_9BURK|nr:hypothetical protein [Telluria cellulosilytica]MVW64252.1 hypothetical protein [Telluria cellulosilytica]